MVSAATTGRKSLCTMTGRTWLRRAAPVMALAAFSSALALSGGRPALASAGPDATARRALGDSCGLASGCDHEDRQFGQGLAQGSTPGSAPDPLFDDDFDWVIDDTVGFPDPFEPVNRVFLGFNRGVDKLLFDPVTQLYRLVLPLELRFAIRRVFLNLGSPPIVVNDLLQGEVEAAGVALGRLCMNTLLGGGGLIDVAAGVGLPRHRADFGQTLALYGVESGPYVVLPIFGPGNVRDTFGGFVDGLMRPATWLLGFTQQIYYGGGSGLSTREENYDALQALVESSVDFYAALRNAYYQSRNGEVWRRRDAPIAVLVPRTEEGVQRANDVRICRWIMRRGPRTGLGSCSRGSRAPHRNRYARTR